MLTSFTQASQKKRRIKANYDGTGGMIIAAEYGSEGALAELISTTNQQ
jgi:hypothetical protein